MAARAALSKPTETIAPPRTPVFTREMLERATAAEYDDWATLGEPEREECRAATRRGFAAAFADDRVLGREAVTEEMVTRALDKGLGGDLDGLGDRFVAEFLRPAVRGVLEDILGIDPAPTGGS